MAASFNTLIDSISVGAIELRSVRVCGTPSIITTGSVPEKEGIPRIKTVGLAPGVPGCITLTPEARPCNASSIRVGRSFSISDPFTVAMAPDTFVRRWVP